MSLSTTTSKIQYTGNGSTTVFAYPFLILDQSHIRITETETTTNVDTVKTLTTHYTVSGVGSSGGGNITATSAPSSTKIWTIERVVPLTQLLALSAASSIPVVELEKALDKLMMAIQQLGTTGSVTDRSIRYKATEPSGFTAEIPLVSDRAGKVLYFATTTGTLTVADANTLFSSQIASITASTATATAAASAASASASDAADSAAAASAAAAASSAIPLWSTGATYTLGAIVRYTDEKIYRCATAHTSGTFATDLAAVKWVELSPDVALTQAQVYDTPQYAVTSGTDTYTATLSPVPSAYISGMRVALKFGNANTGAATINLNSLGAKTIQLNGAALASGDLPANSTANLIYDGTNFQLAGIIKTASSIAHTDWTAYTPTIGGGFGTATSISGRYRKVGSSLECSVEFVTGTVSGSVGTISIPGGFTIVNNGPQHVGFCTQTDTVPDALVYNDGTTVKTNFNANSYHGSTTQNQARFTCEVS